MNSFQQFNVLNVSKGQNSTAHSRRAIDTELCKDNNFQRTALKDSHFKSQHSFGFGICFLTVFCMFQLLLMVTRRSNSSSTTWRNSRCILYEWLRLLGHTGLKVVLLFSSFLPSFLNLIIHSFIPLFLPSFLRSFLNPVLPLSLPFLSPSFLLHPLSSLPSFIPSVCSLPSLSPSLLPLSVSSHTLLFPG